VTSDTSRLLELRRRVQADPASIAFAQLAEEYRRAGDNDEAVGICRAGLQFHPDYLSARVTLGRSLSELGRLSEAQVELEIVLKNAPDNLTANRALAEVLQKRGDLPAALAQYRKALDLAKFDPDLEHELQRIQHAVAPPPAPEPTRPDPVPVAVEDLFNFDTLLEQLGGRTQPKPAIDPPIVMPAPPVASALHSVELRDDANDPFALLEHQLRDNQERSRLAPLPTGEQLRERRLLDALEDWLSAIVTDRDNRPTA
jgi:tetratricopeptide (TPR) repeat protein